MRGHRDLRLVVAAAVACALLAAAIPVEGISLLFAAPLTLFLPGYAIVAATFVREQLAAPMRMGLSLGLSLAILALGGIVLNYTPGGIRGISWSLLLLFVVVVASRLAALRRPAGGQWRLVWPRPASRGAAAMALGGLLASVAALWLAFATLPAKDADGYTELWMQPFAAEGGAGMTVGVGSNEQRPTGYRLHVLVDRDATPIVRRFILEPGEGEVVRLAIDEGEASRPRRAIAELFREAKPDLPYRRVSGWIPPPEEGR